MIKKMDKKSRAYTCIYGTNMKKHHDHIQVQRSRGIAVELISSIHYIISSGLISSTCDLRSLSGDRDKKQRDKETTNDDDDDDDDDEIDSMYTISDHQHDRVGDNTTHAWEGDRETHVLGLYHGSMTRTLGQPRE